jgi:hypothetical protein
MRVPQLAVKAVQKGKTGHIPFDKGALGAGRKEKDRMQGGNPASASLFPGGVPCPRGSSLFFVQRALAALKVLWKTYNRRAGRGTGEAGLHGAGLGLEAKFQKLAFPVDDAAKISEAFLKGLGGPPDHHRSRVGRLLVRERAHGQVFVEPEAGDGHNGHGEKDEEDFLEKPHGGPFCAARPPSYRPRHFLCFFPLPQGHGVLRPGFSGSAPWDNPARTHAHGDEHQNAENMALCPGKGAKPQLPEIEIQEVIAKL